MRHSILRANNHSAPASPTACPVSRRRSRRCRRNNRVYKLITNADGSVDLYFGPKAPAGKEANWIQTVPGEGWFAYLRLYGPLERWFDKTWRPGEIELIP